MDPGFKAKASHALKVAFPGRLDYYIHECLEVKPKSERLYDIRNAINHGNIDMNKLLEITRVEDKQSRLWAIVFGILGQFIPVPRPVDRLNPPPGRTRSN